jgi:ABC-type sulfate transport system permease subunit
VADVVAIERTSQAAEGRARLPSGAALRRWSLRGWRPRYLGLFIVLPVVAIFQHGFGDGLTNLEAALDTFGAKAAIRSPSRWRL